MSDGEEFHTSVFGEGRGSFPSGLCIIDDYVYVTNRNFIVGVVQCV